MSMTELYFAIEVWTEIIVTVLFLLAALVYGTFLLFETRRQKKRHKKKAGD